jgi:hypothetical protein
MKAYRGGETVKPGLYFNARGLSFKSIDTTGALPGTAHDVYRRVPMLALLVAGPLLGLAYVVFLPFVGFAIVGWLLTVKAGHLAYRAAGAAVRVLTPGWEPALAFFSRGTAAKPTKSGTEADAWAKDVRNRLDRANDTKA